MKLDENYHYAWIEHQGITYYSKILKNYSGPSSAVVKLIQGIFDQKIDHSFFILRNRIFTTAESNTLDRAFVRLTAKRIDFGVGLNPEDFINTIEILPDAELIESAHLENKSDIKQDRIAHPEQAIKILSDLVSAIPREGRLHDMNRAIGAILVEASGKILGISTNSNMKNKTLHAEVVLIQEYYKKYQAPLPGGAKIYVSLKPCQMCAAMIDKIKNPNLPIRVYYLENDPGSLAQNTVLDIKNCIEQIKY